MRRRTQVWAAATAASLLCLLSWTVLPIPVAHAEEAYGRPASGSWAVQGHGWGHGRGMSQYGAYGAATIGVGYQSILSAYYPGTTLSGFGNPTVRVKVGVDSTQLRVSGSPGLVAVEENGRVTALPSNVSQWRLVATGSGMRLDGLTNQWVTYGLGGSANVTSSVRFVNSARVLRLWRGNGTSVDYRGEAVAHPSGWSVTTVVHLPLESYLRGVVPRESPASWPDQALRAQAVAARSYAVWELGSPLSGRYDICDTTACQVFGGTTSYSASGVATPLEYPSSDAAIAATSGQILTYQGRVAFTQFSASNGGWSVTGSQPYLVARADPWSGRAPGDRVHAWSAVLRPGDLEARYPSIGSLTRLVVTQRDGNGDWGGRVLRVRLEGTRGQVTVTGSDVMNARPYPSYRDGLRSMWWTLGSGSPTPNVAPQGNVDLATGGDDAVRVAGWAVDRNTAAPIDVHVYVDGANVAATPAAVTRPDIAAAFPGSGAEHGYDLTVRAAPGSREVCVWAINVPAGDNPQLGCRRVAVTGRPFGSVDLAQPAAAGIRVAGWAVDPDTASPVAVHVYLDGAPVTAALAGAPRADVGAAYPAAGPNHGFDTTIPAGPGAHQVCVYAINSPPPGMNPLLGCATVSVPAASPIGALDLAAGTTPGAYRVAGWALDPDTPAPLAVHLYVDGRMDRSVIANLPRPDIAATFPAAGANHGFDVTGRTTAGRHELCVYAIDPTPGVNPSLGCRAVTVG